MQLLIGILIGFVVGIVVAYFAQQSKIKLINQKLKETRRVLEDNEVATKGYAAELQELKREQDKIRQLQAEQKSCQQELEKSYREELETYRVELEQLRRAAEDKFQEQEIIYKAQLQEQEAIYKAQLQEQESIYKAHFKEQQDGNAYKASLDALLAERRELLTKIRQQESQIEALKQAFSQGSTIPETEEDFSEEILLEEPEYSEDSVEKIESLLDVFSDLVAEPESAASAMVSPQIAETIQAIAASGKAAAMPQLTQQMHNSDSKIRALVADTFGNLIEGKRGGLETRQIIANLSKLSRDPEPSVRQSAVTALGKVNSAKVIPLLKIAQRDTDSNVIKSASAALSKFKGYRRTKGKKALPKNASATAVKSEANEP